MVTRYSLLILIYPPFPYTLKRYGIPFWKLVPSVRLQVYIVKPFTIRLMCCTSEKMDPRCAAFFFNDQKRLSSITARSDFNTCSFLYVEKRNFTWWWREKEKKLQIPHTYFVHIILLLYSRYTTLLTRDRCFRTWLYTKYTINGDSITRNEN